METEKAIEFEKRVIGYLEQAGWRVVDITNAKRNPPTFGNRYTAYPDYLGATVCGSPISVAFCWQMQRDFEAGVPGRFLTFPDRSGEAPEKEGEDG